MVLDVGSSCVLALRAACARLALLLEKKLFFEELSFLVLRMFQIYNHWPNKVPTKFYVSQALGRDSSALGP